MSDRVVNQDSPLHLDFVTAHVEKHIGAVDIVLHEIVSQCAHLDILHVPPSKKRNYHVLVTCGMSDRPMKAPSGFAEYRYAELYLCLPCEAPVSFEAYDVFPKPEQKNYWPVSLLKELGRFPHLFDTWLAPRHSLPNGDPPMPYAEGTQMCGAMLCWPILLPRDFYELPVSQDVTIHFCSLLLLYQDAMKFKVEHGGQAL